MNITMSVSGAGGSICAPVCTGPTDTSCPAAPSGWNGRTSCSFSDSMINYHFCGVSCNPYSAGQCGNGATCQVFCNSNSCDWSCLYTLQHEEGVVANITSVAKKQEELYRLHKLEGTAQ